MLTPAVDTYDALRDLCLEISEGGLISSAREREQRKARIYWELGDAIHLHLLSSQGKARHGDQLYVRLARDLKMTRSHLYTVVQFRQQIPNVHTCGHLAWSLCRLLLPLKSAAEREFYARAARQAAWTVSQLQEAIRGDLHSRARQHGSGAYLDRPAGTASRLKPQLGQPYTYRLKGGLPGQDPWLIDLGFSQLISLQPKGLDDPADGMVVTTRKSGDGEAARYHFSRLPGRSRRHLYTYAAIVERVIDGDTIIVSVDCGFRVWTTKRLRLRGIDAPELYSEAGRRAREFVEDALASVSSILMASKSLDPYGRPIADVMYLPGAEDPQETLEGGVYLNRQLLDEGLAGLYGASK